MIPSPFSCIHGSFIFLIIENHCSSELDIRNTAAVFYGQSPEADGHHAFSQDGVRQATDARDQKRSRAVANNDIRSLTWKYCSPSSPCIQHHLCSVSVRDRTSIANSRDFRVGMYRRCACLTPTIVGSLKNSDYHDQTLTI